MSSVTNDKSLRTKKPSKVAMASKYFYISLAQNFCPSKMDMREHNYPFFSGCLCCYIIYYKNSIFLGAISVNVKHMIHETKVMKTWKAEVLRTGISFSFRVEWTTDRQPLSRTQIVCYEEKLWVMTILANSKFSTVPARYTD